MGALRVDNPSRHALERAMLLEFVGRKSEPSLRDHPDISDHPLRPLDQSGSCSLLALVLLRHAEVRPALESLDLVDAGRKELPLVISTGRPLPRELRGRMNLAVRIQVLKILRHPA